MPWKYLPLLLLVICVAFVLLGLVAIFDTEAVQFFWGTHDPAVELLALGATGIAFLAWLKR